MHETVVTDAKSVGQECWCVISIYIWKPVDCFVPLQTFLTNFRQWCFNMGAVSWKQQFWLQANTVQTHKTYICFSPKDAKYITNIWEIILENEEYKRHLSYFYLMEKCSHKKHGVLGLKIINLQWTVGTSWYTEDIWYSETVWLILTTLKLL